jgi:uncharacterized BrkB/YihY/UPF0761 family membrane protein
MCIGYDPFPGALPFAISAIVFGLFALVVFVFELLKKTKKSSLKWAILTFVLFAILSAIIFYYRMNIVADFVNC